MNDRELLELAAKAAGVEVVWNTHWQCFQRREPLQGLGGERHIWVPFEDDGDALRLATAAGIRLTVDAENQVSRAKAGRDGLSFDEYWHWQGEQGAEAATRRAIVRASAASTVSGAAL